MPARSAENLKHLANVCEVVGTDVEFQSRKDASGKVHDYAFVGTMGGGMRIFDVTNPSEPRDAGAYADPGWQNDVQVEGNVAIITFDGVTGEPSTGSTCLQSKPNSMGQGVDILKLDYKPRSADFDVSLEGCVANPPGGAHTATMNPRAQWLAINNCCSDWAVDLVDLRAFYDGKNPRHTYRFIDESKASDPTRCPPDARFECVVVKRPNGTSASGLWRPHDVSFSRDGETMYVAAINSTWIVDVSRVLEGRMRPISIIRNQDSDPQQTSNDIAISHQADVSSDGKILVVSDEKGGGTSNTSCQTDGGEQQVIGALHFYALAPLDGVSESRNASPSNPKKLGIYVNRNPTFTADPLQTALNDLRLERGCTVHVFRLGGNGTAGPGPVEQGFNGVSELGKRELVTAWYGAGTWYMNFSGPPKNNDGIAEDDQTTWGNTKGWIVMPGADTWSSKEYKGHIYTGDMTRGFDVFAFE
jgi:LVIVD repeat